MAFDFNRVAEGRQFKALDSVNLDQGSLFVASTFASIAQRNLFILRGERLADFPTASPCQ